MSYNRLINKIMKKLVTFSTLCILAGLLLSSCSSNLTIAKRHYRGGYYVDYTKKAPSVNYASAKPERKATPVSLSSHELPGIPKQYATADNQISTTLKDVPADKKAPLRARHSVANTKQVLSQPFTVTKSASPAVQQNTPVFAYEGNAGYDDGAGAALSLLWIVVIVVLILWLLGLVAGVGPLINLLLIIALILLILWLLRIA
jgi:hypothetical protein